VVISKAGDGFNLLVVGVGGQGVITLSSVVVHAAVRAGFDVKQSEIHGMAQRGGSVSSHVRVGRKIYSPVIDEGTADIVLALEKLEALRYPHFLAPDGLLIVDDRAIPPLPVSSGEMEYPPDVLERCRLFAGRLEVYSGDALAAAIGSPRMLNTCFAGILSKHLPFDESAWREGIAECFVSRHLEANLRAFETGRSAKPVA
jgi:indolepyruvate ferredoxin oxidoreductase beta subunit